MKGTASEPGLGKSLAIGLVIGAVLYGPILFGAYPRGTKEWAFPVEVVLAVGGALQIGFLVHRGRLIDHHCNGVYDVCESAGVTPVEISPDNLSRGQISAVAGCLQAEFLQLNSFLAGTVFYTAIAVAF